MARRRRHWRVSPLEKTAALVLVIAIVWAAHAAWLWAQVHRWSAIGTGVLVAGALVACVAWRVHRWVLLRPYRRPPDGDWSTSPYGEAATPRATDHPAAVYIYPPRRRQDLARGITIYVGKARNPWKRDDQHRREDAWYPYAGKIQIVQWYRSEREALAAEKALIEQLQPLYNVCHNGGNPDRVDWRAWRRDGAA
jgi:hypothetical protein